MSIGKNISKYRKARNLTQEELGLKLGVTNQAVSKWESEVSMPDVMLLPAIANVLDITLNDLYSTDTTRKLQTQSHIFDTDGIHNFPKEAQSMIIDALYRQTNLLNCGSWDFLNVNQNPLTKKYNSVKKKTTLCCLSDTVGSAFVSADLTVIDSDITISETGLLFEKQEIASGLKKLADPNVRRVLSYICNEYFNSTAPFNCADCEYFEKDVKPEVISHAVGLTSDETLEVLEKLSSLHIVDIKREEDGTHYMFQKIKAIETAVTFRLIERLIHNRFGSGCGDFATLIQL